MRQLSFFSAPTLFHGGELALGKRKGRRPLCRKRSLHFTLKATRGIFPQRILMLNYLVRYAFRFRIELYDLAFEWNYLHFLIKIPNRDACRKFIRAFTGVLARKFGKGLWKLLPFSRIVPWGRAFEIVKKYLQKNRDESIGRRPYEPRRHHYRRNPQAP